MYAGLARQAEGTGAGDSGLISYLGVGDCSCGMSVTSGREGGRACNNVLARCLIVFTWDSRLESVKYLWIWVRWEKGQW